MEKKMIKYFKENIDFKNKKQMYNVNTKITEGDKTDLVTQLLYKYYHLVSTNDGIVYEEQINELQDKYNTLTKNHRRLSHINDNNQYMVTQLEIQISELKDEICNYKKASSDTIEARWKREQKLLKQARNELIDYKRQFNLYENEMIDLKKRERPETEKDEEIKRLKNREKELMEDVLHLKTVKGMISS